MNIYLFWASANMRMHPPKRPTRFVAGVRGHDMPKLTLCTRRARTRVHALAATLAREGQRCSLYACQQRSAL